MHSFLEAIIISLKDQIRGIIKRKKNRLKLNEKKKLSTAESSITIINNVNGPTNSTGL